MSSHKMSVLAKSPSLDAWRAVLRSDRAHAGIAERSQMGIVFGILCVLVAGWLFKLVHERQGAREDESPG